jgi:hypothetical protein
MTRTFRSIIPGRGRGDDSAPRRPGKPVTKDTLDQAAAQTAQDAASGSHGAGKPNDEIGGPDGPEPTRYGDWERGGICYDF